MHTQNLGIVTRIVATALGVISLGSLVVVPHTAQAQDVENDYNISQEMQDRVDDYLAILNYDELVALHIHLVDLEGRYVSYTLTGKLIRYLSSRVSFTFTTKYGYDIEVDPYPGVEIEDIDNAQ